MKKNHKVQMPVSPVEPEDFPESAEEWLPGAELYDLNSRRPHFTGENLRFWNHRTKAANQTDIFLSVVIPIKDERENIPILHEELIFVLEELGEPFEVIWVDDGSMDGSGQILLNISKDDDRVRLIRFRRRFGQTAALSAGFKYARGRTIITMDGDLQNDPHDIPRLLEKMDEGYDLVSGWRRQRQDDLITRKVPSWAANWLINKLIEATTVHLHDFGCSLKAYKSEIVKCIHLYGEMHRFIPVFAAWFGVRIAEIEVNHRPRRFGQTKYSLTRVSRVIFDLIVVRFFADYLTTPIQFFGKIALKFSGMGILGMLLLVLLNLTTSLAVSFDTFVLLAGILMIAGLQILFTGLLGEIMVRSFFDGQGKEYYIIESMTNFDSDNDVRHSRADLR